VHKNNTLDDDKILYKLLGLNQATGPILIFVNQDSLDAT